MSREKKDIFEIIKIINNSEIGSSFESIVNYIKDLENRNKSLREELENYNKEVGIQKLQDEIDRLRTISIGFLSDKEITDSKEFREKHYKECGGRLGFSYIITGTGIGDDIVIRCNKCKEEKNITDVSSW